MEKSLLLKAEVRELAGTKHARRVRNSGRIPAVVYGHKKAPVAILLDAHEFTEGLHHGHRLMDVQIGTKKEKIMVKDVQYDYLGKNVIHADLMRVDITERVKVTVPIELKGTAIGTHEGGIVIEHTDSIEIECLVSDIPETIPVLVKELAIGDSLHAGDIQLPEGMKMLSDSTILIAICSLVAAAKSAEEAEEEAPTAPEVIGQEKEAEGEESSPQK